MIKFEEVCKGLEATREEKKLTQETREDFVPAVDEQEDTEEAETINTIKKIKKGHKDEKIKPHLGTKF